MHRREFAVGLAILLGLFIFPMLRGLELPVVSASQEPDRIEENADSLYLQIRTTGVKPSRTLFSHGIRGYHALLAEGRLDNMRYLTLIDTNILDHDVM